MYWRNGELLRELDHETTIYAAGGYIIRSEQPFVKEGDRLSISVKDGVWITTPIQEIERRGNILS